MNGNVFLDTNVLVYAYDDHEPQKQVRARAVLTQTAQSHRGALSAQVLGEFFVTVTRRIRTPMTTEQALKAIEVFGRSFELIEIDLTLVTSAIGMHRAYQLSYWDGLIIAAARRGGCGRVMSEDLNAGQDYGGVIVENPFAGIASP